MSSNSAGDPPIDLSPPSSGSSRTEFARLLEAAIDQESLVRSLRLLLSPPDTSNSDDSGRSNDALCAAFTSTPDRPSSCGAGWLQGAIDTVLSLAVQRCSSSSSSAPSTEPFFSLAEALCELFAEAREEKGVGGWKQNDISQLLPVSAVLCLITTLQSPRRRSDGEGTSTANLLATMFQQCVRGIVEASGTEKAVESGAMSAVPSATLQQPQPLSEPPSTSFLPASLAAMAASLGRIAHGTDTSVLLSLRRERVVLASLAAPGVKSKPREAHNEGEQQQQQSQPLERPERAAAVAAATSRPTLNSSREMRLFARTLEELRDTAAVATAASSEKGSMPLLIVLACVIVTVKFGDMCLLMSPAAGEDAASARDASESSFNSVVDLLLRSVLSRIADETCNEEADRIGDVRAIAVTLGVLVSYAPGRQSSLALAQVVGKVQPLLDKCCRSLSVRPPPAAAIITVPDDGRIVSLTTEAEDDEHHDSQEHDEEQPTALPGQVLDDDKEIPQLQQQQRQPPSSPSGSSSARVRAGTLDLFSRDAALAVASRAFVFLSRVFEKADISLLSSSMPSGSSESGASRSACALIMLSAFRLFAVLSAASRALTQRRAALHHCLAFVRSIAVAASRTSSVTGVGGDVHSETAQFLFGAKSVLFCSVGDDDASIVSDFHESFSKYLSAVFTASGGDAERDVESCLDAHLERAVAVDASSLILHLESDVAAGYQVDVAVQRKMTEAVRSALFGRLQEASACSDGVLSALLRLLIQHRHTSRLLPTSQHVVTALSLCFDLFRRHSGALLVGRGAAAANIIINNNNNSNNLPSPATVALALRACREMTTLLDDDDSTTTFMEDFRDDLLRMLLTELDLEATLPRRIAALSQLMHSSNSYHLHPTSTLRSNIRNSSNVNIVSRSIDDDQIFDPDGDLSNQSLGTGGNKKKSGPVLCSFMHSFSSGKEAYDDADEIDDGRGVRRMTDLPQQRTSTPSVGLAALASLSNNAAPLLLTPLSSPYNARSGGSSRASNASASLLDRGRPALSTDGRIASVPKLNLSGVLGRSGGGGSWAAGTASNCSTPDNNSRSPLLPSIGLPLHKNEQQQRPSSVPLFNLHQHLPQLGGDNSAAAVTAAAAMSDQHQHPQQPHQLSAGNAALMLRMRSLATLPPEAAHHVVSVEYEQAQRRRRAVFSNAAIHQEALLLALALLHDSTGRCNFSALATRALQVVGQSIESVHSTAAAGQLFFSDVIAAAEASCVSSSQPLQHYLRILIPQQQAADLALHVDPVPIGVGRFGSVHSAACYGEDDRFLYPVVVKRVALAEIKRHLQQATSFGADDIHLHDEHDGADNDDDDDDDVALPSAHSFVVGRCNDAITSSKRTAQKRRRGHDGDDRTTKIFREWTCLRRGWPYTARPLHLFNDGEHVNIVMEKFTTSLAGWRSWPFAALRYHLFGESAEKKSSGKSSGAGTGFDLVELLRVYLRACTALCRLHERGIVHGDVKLENFAVRTDSGGAVLDYDNIPATAPTEAEAEISELPIFATPTECVVIDFGEAEIVNYDHRKSNNNSELLSNKRRNSIIHRRQGTELVSPPEILLEHLYPLAAGAGGVDEEQTKRDVWSAGCMLFQLITGRFIFENEHEPAVLMGRCRNMIDIGSSSNNDDCGGERKSATSLLDVESFATRVAEDLNRCLSCFGGEHDSDDGDDRRRLSEQVQSTATHLIISDILRPALTVVAVERPSMRSLVEVCRAVIDKLECTLQKGRVVVELAAAYPSSPVPRWFKIQLDELTAAAARRTRAATTTAAAAVDVRSLPIDRVAMRLKRLGEEQIRITSADDDDSSSSCSRKKEMAPPPRLICPGITLVHGDCARSAFCLRVPSAQTAGRDDYRNNDTGDRDVAEMQTALEQLLVAYDDDGDEEAGETAASVAAPWSCRVVDEKPPHQQRDIHISHLVVPVSLSSTTLSAPIRATVRKASKHSPIVQVDWPATTSAGNASPAGASSLSDLFSRFLSTTRWMMAQQQQQQRRTQLCGVLSFPVIMTLRSASGESALSARGSVVDLGEVLSAFAAFVAFGIHPTLCVHSAVGGVRCCSGGEVVIVEKNKLHGNSNNQNCAAGENDDVTSDEMLSLPSSGALTTLSLSILLCKMFIAQTATESWVAASTTRSCGRRNSSLSSSSSSSSPLTAMAEIVHNHHPLARLFRAQQIASSRSDSPHARFSTMGIFRPLSLLRPDGNCSALPRTPGPRVWQCACGRSAIVATAHRQQQHAAASAEIATARFLLCDAADNPAASSQQEEQGDPPEPPPPVVCFFVVLPSSFEAPGGAYDAASLDEFFCLPQEELSAFARQYAGNCLRPNPTFCLQRQRQQQPAEGEEQSLSVPAGLPSNVLTTCVLSVSSCAVAAATTASAQQRRQHWSDNAVFSFYGALVERPRIEYLMAVARKKKNERQEEEAAERVGNKNDDNNGEQQQQQSERKKGGEGVACASSPVTGSRVMCCAVCGSTMAWSTAAAAAGESSSTAPRVVILSQFEGHFGCALVDLRDV